MTQASDDPQRIFGTVAPEIADLRQQVLKVEDAILVFLDEKQLKTTDSKLGFTLQGLDQLAQSLGALEGVCEALSVQTNLDLRRALGVVPLEALRDRMQTTFDEGAP